MIYTAVTLIFSSTLSIFLFRVLSVSLLPTFFLNVSFFALFTFFLSHYCPVHALRLLSKVCVFSPDPLIEQDCPILSCCFHSTFCLQHQSHQIRQQSYVVQSLLVIQ